MLSFHVKFVQTDGRTTVKQYAPDLSIQGQKMQFELSPLIVWIVLWMVSTYSKFLGNILNKKTMMVLYRSPEYQVVKVYNGYKYQIS